MMALNDKIGTYGSYLWRIWFVVLAFSLTVVVFLPVFVLSFNKKHYRYAYFFIRMWSIFLFYGMGLRYDLINNSGQKIDRKNQYIIISNHTSMMDIMLMFVLFPYHPICFVGKQELEKIPIFGLIYKRICVMVDRNSSQSRAKVYEKCAERISQKNSIVIFPEGGIPDDTNVVLDKFKDGAFKISEEHCLPIVVFTFSGLKKIFPYDNSKGRPGRVKVYLNSILEPSQSSINKNKAFEIIENTLLNSNQ